MEKGREITFPPLSGILQTPSRIRQKRIFLYTDNRMLRTINFHEHRT